VGSRHVSATERDLTAMLESDQVPDRLKKQTGPGSPMWIYVKFRSYMEEVAPTENLTTKIQNPKPKTVINHKS